MNCLYNVDENLLRLNIESVENKESQILLKWMTLNNESEIE